MITLVMCFDYFAVGMGFYGLTLSAGPLSADPFIYMVLSGLMEVPSTTLGAPLVHRLGRKVLTAASYIIAGTALLAQPLIPEGKYIKVLFILI